MKKLLLAMTAIPALAVAAPVAAQYQTQAYGNAGVDNRIDRLEARFQAGVQQGTISRQEAQPLRQQLRQLARLEARYSADGLSQQERADLNQRIRSLRQQLRVADGGGYDRYDRDNYDDNGYASNDRIDRNRDGWDDRDLDRDGRWDDDVNSGRYGGRGGPLEAEGWYADDQCESRTGIAAVFARVFGADNCLRIGERAPTNLYAVPYEYRGQFRDRNGLYYRSDGNRIYGIDARTGAVVRVYRRDLD
jgi:hypothetical protein